MPIEIFRMHKIIDGKALAEELLFQLAERISSFCPKCCKPRLHAIIVGDNPASQVYVNNKIRACKKVGIESEVHHLPQSTSTLELQEIINNLNHTADVHGILVQLPLPDHINPTDIIEVIDPKKDVDGFHPYNIGRLAARNPTLRPCTPAGVMHILNSLDVPIKGKHAVVVGASNIVGRPLVLELLLAGATVTCCHRFTENLSNITQKGDILISAVGKPKFINSHAVKPQSIVIDVGITRTKNGLVGDVDFEEVKSKVSYITPVPGGVGPLTVAMLLLNTIHAYNLQRHK